MSFWDKAKQKLDSADLMKERTYRGRELEQATTTYLKIKFIKAALEQGEVNEQEVENS